MEEGIVNCPGSQEKRMPRYLLVVLNATKTKVLTSKRIKLSNNMTAMQLLLNIKRSISENDEGMK